VRRRVVDIALMKTCRPARSRIDLRLRRAVWLSCFAACATSTAAQAGDCVNMRGGDLLVSASPGCAARLRRDPVMREQVTQRIGGLTGRAAVFAAPPPMRAPLAQRERHHGLDHPLARLSMLNAQSRYLWSLGNPSPTYYGQTPAR
jgi:hypothetical protein